MTHSDSFRRSLKTFLFATYWDMQRIRGSTRMRYTNLLLLTYLLRLSNATHCWASRLTHADPWQASLLKSINQSINLFVHKALHGNSKCTVVTITWIRRTRLYREALIAAKKINKIKLNDLQTGSGTQYTQHTKTFNLKALNKTGKIKL